MRLEGKTTVWKGTLSFAHELEEFHLLRVDPPFLVLLLEVVGSDGDVADGGVEPDIEHLLSELLERD